MVFGTATTMPRHLYFNERQRAHFRRGNRKMMVAKWAIWRTWRGQIRYLPIASDPFNAIKPVHRRFPKRRRYPVLAHVLRPIKSADFIVHLAEAQTLLRGP